MTSKIRPGEFIEAHRLLEADIQTDRSSFVSDWNGRHPFVQKFLGKSFPGLDAIARSGKYLYLDDEVGLATEISSFHSRNDQLEIGRSNIVAGAGSSSLLAAFCLWLLHEGEDTVFCIPPLYYTFRYVLKLLGIRPRRVTSKHLFEEKVRLNLPDRKSVLLMTDPVWYAGWPTPKETIHALAAWQRRTRSVIFVDGSFQYTNWSGSRQEHTASLDPERTFRLICPAKALGIPTYRFAYLLLPSKFQREFLFIYESMIGSSSVGDVQFARRAMKVLNSRTNNRPFTSWLQARFKRLQRDKLIEEAVLPSCGYFIFAKPKNAIRSKAKMGEKLFDLKGYPDYVRINLMGTTAPLRFRDAKPRA